LFFAIAPGWDHGGFSRGAKRVNHTLIGIECFVCQQSMSLHPRQQCVGAFQIMGFAKGQKEGEWIAQGVNQRVDFGAQPAVAGPDRLVLAVFFLGAGAVLVSAHSGAVNHSVFIVRINERRVDLIGFPKRSGKSRQGIPAR
jgi:hypothetical protein